MNKWSYYLEDPNEQAPKWIDTTELVSSVSPDYVLLKRNKLCDVDFKIIHERVFRKLVAWYVAFEGQKTSNLGLLFCYSSPSLLLTFPCLVSPRFGRRGPKIERVSVLAPTTMPQSQSWTVPVHPSKLTLITCTREGLDTVKRSFLAFYYDTLREIHQRIALKFGVTPYSIRLWDFDNNSYIKDLDQTLDNASLGGRLLVELADPKTDRFFLTDLWRLKLSRRPSAQASSFVDLPSTYSRAEPKPDVPTIDHTILIDYPHHTFDLTLQHGLSGTSWNLPLQIARQLGIATETLISTVKNSSLPESSIGAFIRYLCLSTPDPQPSRQSIVRFSHISHLLVLIGLDTDHVLNDLDRALLNMPYEDAIHGLLDVWIDDVVEWSLDNALIHVLVARIRSGQIDKFTEISTTRLSTRIFPLCMFVSSSRELVPCPKDPSPREWRPEGPAESVIPSSEISSVHPSASDMIFIIKLDESSSLMISESLVVLLPQWLWIRRMFESGGSEAKTRACHLPAWLNHRIFMAILRTLRGYHPRLGQEDALALLEHAAELDLSNSLRAPLEPFVKLLSRAKDTCFPPITEENCLSHLDGYHRLGMTVELNQTLEFIVSVMSSLTGDQIFRISPELIIMIHERVKRQHEKNAQNER